MADPVVPQPAPDVTSAAPAVPAAPVAPASSPSPAPAEATPAAPEPVVEAPAPAAPAPAESAFKHHSEEPSLLEKAAKPPEPEKPTDPAKPTEAAKPGEAPKPGEPAAPVEPAAAKLEPIEYKYTLPETLKLDDAEKAVVHGLFDEFRANPAEAAQKLIDYHNGAMQKYADALQADQLRSQNEAFRETRKAWNDEVKADPEIGGSGHATAMTAIARMRDKLVPQEMLAPRSYEDGSPRLSEFEEFLRMTGAGDNRVFLRILHRAARFLDEPQARDLPTEIKPSPTNGQAPKTRSLYRQPPASRQ